MSKTITLRLTDDEYELLAQTAAGAKRTISNLITYLALKKIFEGRAAKIRKKLQDFICPQLKLSPEYGSNIKMLHDFDPPVWLLSFFLPDRQDGPDHYHDRRRTLPPELPWLSAIVCLAWLLSGWAVWKQPRQNVRFHVVPAPDPI